MRRIVGLILIVALTIFATVAETFRNNLWTSYRDYSSPYLSDLPAGPPRRPASPRVVLVLARGLRLETSRQMPTLNALRGRGADIIVRHDPPTYRLPVWITLISGASAEIHGVTTNYAPRAGGASSIFRELQQSGDATAIIGSQSLGDIFGGDAQRFEVVDNPDITQRDDDAIRITLEVLRDTANPARLVCVELTAIEETQQAAAATDDAATSVTDDRIKTLLEALDLNTNTLVILADRGLTLDGNDGGAEPEVALAPLVMAGAGVSAGSQVMINANDVAPTLAALTGSPLPVHAQGQPAIAVLAIPTGNGQEGGIAATASISTAVEITQTLAPLPALLWGSAAQLTTFYESWSETIKQPRFAAELLRASQAAIQNGDTNAYQIFVIDLGVRAGAARTARLDTERAQRLPAVIGAALFLIALLGVALTSRHWQPLLGAALYVLAWYALFTFVFGRSLSLSMFANSDPAAFLNELARDSAALLIIVSVVVAVTTRAHEDGLEAIATVLTTVMLIVGVQVAMAVWFYFQWGDNFTWNLPDSAALVNALMALTQASALSLRIVPELPSLPTPLVIAFLTLGIFSMVRQRERRGTYGRLR